MPKINSISIVEPNNVKRKSVIKTTGDKSCCSGFVDLAVRILGSMSTMEREDEHDDEREDPAGFTKDFLQRTSLHGLQLGKTSPKQQFVK